MPQELAPPVPVPEAPPVPVPAIPPVPEAPEAPPVLEVLLVPETPPVPAVPPAPAVPPVLAAPPAPVLPPVLAAPPVPTAPPVALVLVVLPAAGAPVLVELALTDADVEVDAELGDEEPVHAAPTTRSRAEARWTLGSIASRYLIQRVLMTYICPETVPRPANPTNVERIAGPARSLEFPDWYVARIESFRP